MGSAKRMAAWVVQGTVRKRADEPTSARTARAFSRGVRGVCGYSPIELVRNVSRRVTAYACPNYDFSIGYSRLVSLSVRERRIGSTIRTLLEISKSFSTRGVEGES